MKVMVIDAQPRSTNQARSFIGRTGPVFLLAGLLGLAACTDANSADQAKAAAIQNQIGEGTNERPHQADDRIERADAMASEDAANALENRGEQLRAQADVEAGRLDDRARALRADQK